MIIAWMAYAVGLAALAYVAAAAAERVVAVWRGGRRFVWAAALAAATVVPAFLATEVRATRESLSPAAFDARARAGTLAPRSSGDGRAISAARIDGMIGKANGARLTGLLNAVDPYALGAWVLVSGILVALYLGAAIRLHVRSRRWHDAELDGERVLVAPELGPAVVGVLAPRIVVPGWVRSLDARARMFMLRHEDEHIRARDPQLLAVAALLLLIFPWNPALWLIVDRLRLAIEMDCDARVLLDRDQSREYGRLLLAVCARQSRAWPLVASLAEHAPHIERRLIAMTAAPARRATLTSIALGALAIAVVVIACGAPRPVPLRSAPHYVNGVLVLQDVKVSGYLSGEQAHEVTLGDSVPGQRRGPAKAAADSRRTPQKAP